MIDKSKFFVEKIILKYNSSIGELEFRFISGKDVKYFRKLDKKISNKDFAIKSIFNQLGTNIDFNKFSEISDSEMKIIIEEYSKKSKPILKYYSKTESLNEFLKFKKSILCYLKEEEKRMELMFKSINHQFEPLKKIFAQSTAFSRIIEQQTTFSKLLSHSLIPKIPSFKIPKSIIPDFIRTTNWYILINKTDRMCIIITNFLNCQFTIKS